MIKKSSFTNASDLFAGYKVPQKAGYIAHEFQLYGYKLALELNDEQHKSLYIKMAKEQPRGLLEAARSFVADATAKKKAALFMWKFKQLKKEHQDKKKQAQAGKQPSLLANTTRND